MSGFRHILCPVDFSERSKAIRPYVKAFVERFNAKLTLLNAVEIPPPETFGVDQSFPVMFDFPSLEPVLLNRLKDYFDSIEATRVVQLGDPAIAIADYARDNQVDLIMMPTHGYGRFAACCWVRWFPRCFTTWIARFGPRHTSRIRDSCIISSAEASWPRSTSASRM